MDLRWVTVGHTISDSAVWITCLLPVNVNVMVFDTEMYSIQVVRLPRLPTSVRFASSQLLVRGL